MLSPGLQSRNHIVLCVHESIGLGAFATLFSDLCLFTHANCSFWRQRPEVTAKSSLLSLWPTVFMDLALDKIQGLHSGLLSRMVAMSGLLNLNMGLVYGL